MDISKLEEIGRNALINFYNEKKEPDYELLDEDILILGPYEKMFIKGRDNLKASWVNVPRMPEFEINNMSTHIVELDKRNCEIVYMFFVYTKSDNNRVMQHAQRVQFTWNEKKVTQEDGSKIRECRLKMVHMSNSVTMATHSEAVPQKYESEPPMAMSIASIEEENRIELTGLNRTTYYFIPKTIRYIQSTDNATHSVIHTLQGDITVIDTVASIEKRYGDIFVRCHQSYIVNPAYVASVKRFELQIFNGPTIPVPEKKYTKIKARISQFAKKTHLEIE